MNLLSVWAQDIWKSSKKKGFTIIEALCTLSIITILFSYIMQVELKNIRIKQYLEIKEKYICLLEAVSNELTYNASYFELISLSEDKKIYIDSENMNLQKIRSSKITDCFTNKVPLLKPYIVIFINKDKVLKVNTRIYFKYVNKEEMIECESFKGNY